MTIVFLGAALAAGDLLGATLAGTRFAVRTLLAQVAVLDSVVLLAWPHFIAAARRLSLYRLARSPHVRIYYSGAAVLALRALHRRRGDVWAASEHVRAPGAEYRGAGAALRAQVLHALTDYPVQVTCLATRRALAEPTP